MRGDCLRTRDEGREMGPGSPGLPVCPAAARLRYNPVHSRSIRPNLGPMKVVILAAGYATRLYPLTLTRPKPLLSVAGKPMIDYVLDNLAPIGGIDRVYIVTNAKFAEQFQKWSEDYKAHKTRLDFTIVNDR